MIEDAEAEADLFDLEVCRRLLLLCWILDEDATDEVDGALLAGDDAVRLLDTEDAVSL